MKNILFVFSIAVTFSLTSYAKASQVQYALPVSDVPVIQLGTITAGSLVASTLINGPSDMNGTPKYWKVNLGTNTDLYLDPWAPWQSWVSYTLDASSSATHTYDWYPHSGTNAITGVLWLSFNTQSQIFKIYANKMGNLSGSDSTFLPFRNQQSINMLKDGYTPYPDYYTDPEANASIGIPILPCLECSYSARLNLSFLQLSWVGDGYDLLASSQGFDQVLILDESSQGVSSNYSFNIAPVPLPNAAWLISSAMLCLFAKTRRKFKIVSGLST